MQVKLFCELHIGDTFYIPIRGTVEYGSVPFMKIHIYTLYDAAYNTCCLESRFYYYIEESQEVWTDEI